MIPSSRENCNFVALVALFEYLVKDVEEGIEVQ